MNPFQKARLKLTFWYILISISLLVVFSVAAITAERRAFRRIEEVLANRVQRPKLTTLLETRLAAFDRDFQNRLFLFDGILLVVASTASFFLSGKTLQPIAEMIKKQEDFAADASHELRTPLTILTMEIEAVKRTEKNIPLLYSRLFESIQQEVKRMHTIVDGLLTLVRVEGEKEKIRREVFDIGKLAKDSVEQMRPLAQKKKIRLDQEESKKVLVRGSRDQIKQVLLILVDNAIKYTDRNGRITISLTFDKGKIALRVADTGRGISQKDIPFIFDRFYRGKGEKQSQKGVGLGLSIARKIIESHKGKIYVESSEAKGSTFTVSLPLYS